MPLSSGDEFELLTAPLLPSPPPSPSRSPSSSEANGPGPSSPETPATEPTDLAAVVERLAARPFDAVAAPQLRVDPHPSRSSDSPGAAPPEVAPAQDRVEAVAVPAREADGVGTNPTQAGASDPDGVGANLTQTGVTDPDGVGANLTQTGVTDPDDWWDDALFSPSTLAVDHGGEREAGLPSERAGAAGVVEPRLPTLPPAAAVPVVPSGAVGGARGSAPGIVPFTQFPPQATSKRRRGRVGARIVKALLLVVVTVVAGVGAGLAWDAYDQRGADSSGATGERGGPAFESLAVGTSRPTATRIEVSLEAPTRTIVLRTDLVSGDLAFDLVEQLPDGPRHVQVERVDDLHVRREWTPTGWIQIEDDAVDALAAELSVAAPDLVLTLGDVAPPAMWDHVTVLEHDEELLTGVDPIVPAPDAATPAASAATSSRASDPASATDDTSDDTSTDLGSILTDHFVLSIDTDAVATTLPALFDSWKLVDRLGIESARLEPVTIDVWVDESGVVRRMSHGGEVTTVHRIDDQLPVVSGAARVVGSVPTSADGLSVAP